WFKLEVQAVSGEDQAILGHFPEIRVTVHQAALPGVLQLLETPGIAERRPLARKQLLAQLDDGGDVVERPVSVESEPLDLLEIWASSRTRRAWYLRCRALPGQQSGASGCASYCNELQEISPFRQHLHPPCDGSLRAALARGPEQANLSRRRNYFKAAPAAAAACCGGQHFGLGLSSRASGASGGDP